MWTWLLVPPSQLPILWLPVPQLPVSRVPGTSVASASASVAGTSASLAMLVPKLPVPLLWIPVSIGDLAGVQVLCRHGCQPVYFVSAPLSPKGGFSQSHRNS